MSIIGGITFFWGFAIASSAFGSLDKPMWSLTFAFGGAALMFWGLNI